MPKGKPRRGGTGSTTNLKSNQTVKEELLIPIPEFKKMKEEKCGKNPPLYSRGKFQEGGEKGGFPGVQWRMERGSLVLLGLCFWMTRWGRGSKLVKMKFLNSGDVCDFCDSGG